MFWGGTCKVACADSGYANMEELKGVESQGIKVIVPSQMQALHEPTGPFHNDKFIYDKDRDCYICPEGASLCYRKTDYGAGKKAYQVKKSSICRSCKHYGRCAKSKEGRAIVKLIDDESKRRSIGNRSHRLFIDGARGVPNCLLVILNRTLGCVPLWRVVCKGCKPRPAFWRHASIFSA